MAPLRVTIWNEFVHEKTDPQVMGLYRDGIHEHLQRVLRCDDFAIRTAHLHMDAEHGLSEDVLRQTDVLIWWGHMAHEQVPNAVAERVARRVYEGMGFIPLHSAHMSKPFLRLMGTPCTLRWREQTERAHVWTVAPGHPIAKGVPLHFTLESEEMYGEVFQIPKPDDIVFITWFQGGNVFRGGCTFTRGLGRIFYFHPGHETTPSYHNENVLAVIRNASRWAAPAPFVDLKPNCQTEPLERW